MTSANKFACGTSQNTGNVMTDRPTSRVLAAPGGRSSMGSLLFGGGGPSPAKRSVARAAPAPAKAAEAKVAKPAVVAKPGKSAEPLREISYAQSSRTDPTAISANKYACGASQNTGNVMTGRSSTRLHAPPGGRSSISFG